MNSWRPNRSIAAEVVAELELRRQVERLHAKGSRVVGELLAEIGAERGITTIIETKLERYNAIDNAELDAFVAAHTFVSTAEADAANDKRSDTA